MGLNVMMPRTIALRLGSAHAKMALLTCAPLMMELSTPLFATQIPVLWIVWEDGAAGRIARYPSGFA